MFTAHELWSEGDTWGCGGLFALSKAVEINSASHNLKPTQGEMPHQWPKVISVSDYRTLDRPMHIEDIRMERDGWVLEQEKKWSLNAAWWEDKSERYQFAIERPEIWRKQSKAGTVLRFIQAEAGERSGRWHVCSGHLTFADGTEARDSAEFVPISAETGEGLDVLVDLIVQRLPPGPQLYPDDMVTDVPEAFWVAELVREQLLAIVRDELPHSIATRVTEGAWPRVRCEILVERDSQKAIVIGKKGAVLKQVGIEARKQMPEGAFLELHVKVDADWQRRPRALERLGYGGHPV